MRSVGGTRWTHHIALLADVAHKSFLINVVQIPSDTAVGMNSERFQVLLRCDPLVQRIDLEVCGLNFESIVDIIVEAIGLGVEEREDFRAAHVRKEMREEVWVRVNEIRAVALWSPVVVRREAELEPAGVGDQDICGDFEETTCNVERDDVGTPRLSVHGVILEGHFLSP